MNLEKDPFPDITNLFAIKNASLKKSIYFAGRKNRNFGIIMGLLKYKISKMKQFIVLMGTILCFSQCRAQIKSVVEQPVATEEIADDIAIPIVSAETFANLPIITGAERTKEYLPLLTNKRIALVVNQTSTIGKTHLADSLLSLHVNITKIFGPEHGFRGTADAGAHIDNGKDPKTGLPIISLYGDNKKPTAEQLKDIDLLIFDIQDVGARFYTYISTLHYVMEAAAENGKQVIVFDRPNPNGHYVDGPVLDPENSSFVGMDKIPVVHGLTIAEYAQMLNGEKWLKNGVQCNLIVIQCLNYDHQKPYAPPIPPSPNLRDLQAIYLYPSLCLFEGTPISVGRGTDFPFKVFGHPTLNKYPFSFTPGPKPGANNPLLNGQRCYGVSFSEKTPEELRNTGFTLKYLIEVYQQFPTKTGFFNNFFTNLIGNTETKNQIVGGLTEEMIRKSWKEDLDAFKVIRQKYLLYPK